MSNISELNNYHIRTLFLSFLLQMEKNGQQVIIHHDTIKEAQKRCDPRVNADLWQWICNPLAKTYQFIPTTPKPETSNTMEKAFSELWSELEEQQNAIRAVSGGCSEEA